MNNFSIGLWNATDGEHLATWYSEEGAQVPRKGDVLWLDTDNLGHGRWRVCSVQWVFKDRAMGISRYRTNYVEVWITPKPTTPLWQRFVALFPRSV
jgi:hypothetical protein